MFHYPEEKRNTLGVWCVTLTFKITITVTTLLCQIGKLQCSLGVKFYTDPWSICVYRINSTPNAEVDPPSIPGHCWVIITGTDLWLEM